MTFAAGRGGLAGEALDHGPVDWVLLARHFAGEATPAETREIARWIRDDPRRREELVALRVVWESIGRAPDAARLDAMYDVISPVRKPSSAREPRAV